MMKNFLKKVERFPSWVWLASLKMGKEDPSKVIHLFQLGMSLTLVSLLYVLEPSFEGIGNNAIWAVMTVVVVLEFTAGQFVFQKHYFPFGLLFLLFIYFSFDYYEYDEGKKNGLIWLLFDWFWTIGATLCKGLNRGLGTLIAGSYSLSQLVAS